MLRAFDRRKVFARQDVVELFRQALADIGPRTDVHDLNLAGLVDDHGLGDPFDLEQRSDLPFAVEDHRHVELLRFQEPP